MLTGFDHVTIAVQDIDAAVDRYERLLGAPAHWRGGHPELGTRGAIFALRNAAIELTAPSEATEAEGLRAWLQARGEGVQAIAFACADAAACSAQLRERGVRATAASDGEARGDDGARRAYRSIELSPRAARGLSVLAVERADVSALRPSAAVPVHAADALDHVVIRTADPEAAIALYGGGLGIRLALDRELAGTRMLFFRTGGVTIEVVGDANAGENDAFYGLAYRVGDIEEAHARMQGEGCDVSEVRNGRKPGTRVFTVRDGTCGVPTLILRDPARD
jgi:catechol 2,3-dioxygenase-like lactoylglutathione lyase family enzyme